MIGQEISFLTSGIRKNPVFSKFLLNLKGYSTKEDKEPTIYFVLPPGCDLANCDKIMVDTYKLATKLFLRLELLEDEECLHHDLLHRSDDAFVFSEFGTKGFVHVSSFPEIIILSPTLLHKYLMSPLRYNDWQLKGHPKYNLAMSNVVICFSGFTPAKRKELEALVQYMSGKVSGPLTKSVTSLVVSSSLTAKCVQACKVGIPVWTEQWVREIWKDSMTYPKSYWQQDYENFKCPIFHNVEICLSGFTMSDEDTLRRAIEQHGGKYSRILTQGKTAVLVSNSVDGTKYKFAKKWGIQCVTSEWVEICIQRSTILPTNGYQMLEDETGSTTNWSQIDLIFKNHQSHLEQWKLKRWCSTNSINVSQKPWSHHGNYTFSK